MDEREGMARLIAFEGPAIVDFDETLYLRNSTEQFLDAAAPRMLGVALLRVLEAFRPWALTGRKTIDVWRVTCVTVLLPWTLFAWRRKSVALAPQFANAPLVRALRERGGDVRVATLGFHPIVRPLLDAMALADVPLAASRLHSFEDRRRGKLFTIARAFGRETIADALVFTDSEDDRPLLDACASPILVRWPQARYERAGRGLYFPLDYLTQVKRPGKGMLKSLVMEDLSTWLLASAPFLLTGWRPLAALLLLFAAFWSIYELGYVENDITAAEHERGGEVPANFDAGVARTFAIKLWCYALALGLAAALLTPFHPLPMAVARALGLIVFVRIVYHLYNRVDRMSRVWLYIVLQALRVYALAALVPLSIVGVALTSSLAVTRWLSYIVYRLGTDGARYSWPTLPTRLIRLALFAILIVGLAAAGALGGRDAWLLAASVGWLALLARHDLRSAARALQPVARSG